MDDIRAFARAVLAMRSWQIECECIPSDMAEVHRRRAEAKVDHCLDHLIPMSSERKKPPEGTQPPVG